jgi:hypothetical protein
MRTAVISAVVTAAVSTVGDYLWANVLPHGPQVYWFAHAIILFLTIGACLGLPSRRPLAGAAGAVVIGCLATAGFWVLRPIVGYAGSLFLLFTLLWVALGVLTGRVLQRRDNIGAVLVRSALAAVGSGLAFYAISGSGCRSTRTAGTTRGISSRGRSRTCLRSRRCSSHHGRPEGLRYECRGKPRGLRTSSGTDLALVAQPFRAA